MGSNKPSAFEIPSLIPPLPTTTKENDRTKTQAKPLHSNTSSAEVSKESPHLSSKSKVRPVLALRTPLNEGKENRLPKSAKETRQRLHLSPSPNTSALGSTRKERRSVLRFGETAESLFCLSSQGPPELRQLSRGIVDGLLADDASAWRKVLQIAADFGAANGTSLIRLHRRAALRFPVDLLRAEDNTDVLDIWLAFASLHAKLGMVEEARRTYRHIENQNIALDASYYVQVAHFEQKQDHTRAEDTLLRGIAQKAEPICLLKETFDILRATMRQSGPISTDSRPIAINLSPGTRILGSDSSPKRQRTNHGFLAREVNGEVDRSRSQIVKPQPNETTAIALSPPRVPKPTTKASASASAAVADKTTATPKIAQSNSEGPKKVLSSRRPSRLMSARLSRKGLSGKAKRVEAEISVLEESESEQENHHGGNTTDDFTSHSESQAAAPKMKKTDLSYMWDWNPNARGKTEELKQHPPPMDRIEETCSSGQTTNASHATNRSAESTITAATAATTNQVSISKPTIRASEDNKEASKGAQEKQPALACSEVTNEAVQTRKMQSRKDELLSRANMEFLPLVHENNILRVNRTSYAKLGVIGKGGSCKVYRALSKKCSVVAIKKVKLDGMDKKAIEGYANEISLLKRLRGNPAIIQMYDSEVDLARKSLFVVMELGEADLNHILQQRALSGTCRSLNMNFIRLTWQQMLSAVHCIHEERIIHSDLKPANFLFVRGALKLIDFGIAKAIQSDDTTNIYRESHIGTLNYMSPEAILDTETGTNGPRMRIGRASDVWSLGCILYEMVYGKTPFAKLHFIQKLQAIVNPNHRIDFPEEGDEAAIDAIKHCLRRDPDDRPLIIGKNGLLSEHRFLHASSSLKKAPD